MTATNYQDMSVARGLRTRTIVLCVVPVLFTTLVFAVAGNPTARSQGPAPGVPASEFIIPTPLEIEITGTKFHWEIHYPGPDGELGTEDDRFGDRELHLPLDASTRIHLRSRDYIYSFALPHLQLKEIAVPEMEFFIDFIARASGTFELRGDQLCGFAHPDLLGKLVVGTPEQYAAEMNRLRRE